MNPYPNKWEVWTNSSSSSSSTLPETALLGGHASRFFLLRPIHPMSSPGSQAMQRQEPSCNYCWPRYRGIGWGKAKHPDFLTFSSSKNPFFFGVGCLKKIICPQPGYLYWLWLTSRVPHILFGQNWSYFCRRQLFGGWTEESQNGCEYILTMCFLLCHKKFHVVWSFLLAVLFPRTNNFIMGFFWNAHFLTVFQVLPRNFDPTAIFSLSGWSHRKKWSPFTEFLGGLRSEKQLKWYPFLRFNLSTYAPENEGMSPQKGLFQ